MTGCIVVGAGISGLTAAWELERRGVETLVLEATARTGGKIESTRDAGFLVESGPQGFLKRGAELTRLAEELQLAPVDALPAARRRALAIGGRLVDVPAGPLDFLRTPLLSARGKLRLAADLWLPRGAPADETVASFARRRLGSEAAEHIFAPLVSGLFAGDAERISISAAFPLLADLERDHRSLIAGAVRSLFEERTPGARLQTFAGGMEELPRALTARLGARVRRSAAVRQIARAASGWQVSVEEGGRVAELSAPSLLLALPAYAAAQLLRPLDARAADAAAAIAYAPLALAWTAWADRDLPRALARYGFLTAPAEGSPLLGAVFASAAFGGRAPAGTSLVSALLGGARHPEVASLGDDDLAQLVHRELRPLLEARGEPRFFKTIRHTHALPQYTLGHAERVAALDAAEVALPGLHFAGAGYRGVGVPDCVRAATRAADRIGSWMRRAASRAPTGQ